MKSNGAAISRRETLSRFAGLLISTSGSLKCHGQSGLEANANAKGTPSVVGVKLAHEFRNSFLLGICPTGRKICLHFTHHPIDSFTVRDGKWTNNSKGSHLDDVLGIVEMGSWKATYSVHMREKVYHASFFADGEHVYAETSSFTSAGQLSRQHMIVDLQSGEQEEQVRSNRQSVPGIYYFALDNRTLLGTEFSRNPTRYTAIERSTWPNFQETARTPYAITSERDPIGHDREVNISADRRKLIYSTDHSLVYRRSEDLGLMWTREIEQEYFGAVCLSISPDGRWAAAAVVDTTFVEHQRKFYVEVYAGADGTTVARLPLKGDQAIAISPDGKYLAVGERIDATIKDKYTYLAVSIFEISSGQRVARVIHDQIYIHRRGDWLNSNFGPQYIQFTADGKYLITSSIHTKIWELSVA